MNENTTIGKHDDFGKDARSWNMNEAPQRTDGGFAFPGTAAADGYGMTLLDYFAGRAFERLVQLHIDARIPQLSKAHVAAEAYSYAQYMVKVRRSSGGSAGGSVRSALADEIEAALLAAYRANDDVRFDSAIEALRVCIKNRNMEILRLEDEADKARSELRKTIASYEESCEKMRQAMSEMMKMLADAMVLPADDPVRDSYSKVVDSACERIKRLESAVYKRVENEQLNLACRFRLAHMAGVPQGEVGEHSDMKLVEMVYQKLLAASGGRSRLSWR